MRELRRTGEEEKRFDDMMKITFLLGSGVSVPAGFPTVNELTESVLLGDGIVKQDGNDSTANDSSQSHDGHNRLLFLHWLKAQAMARYVDDPNRQINYEDLAYLAGQIADDIDYEYENPAIHQFVLKAPTARFHSNRQYTPRAQRIGNNNRDLHPPHCDWSTRNAAGNN